jgi:hypothetical protein
MLDVYDTTKDAIELASDKFTTKSCAESLSKFRRIAWVLRYNPTASKAFKKGCFKNKERSPFSIPRDVRTQWNSTYFQLQAIVRLQKSVRYWQKLPEIGILFTKEQREGDRDFFFKSLTSEVAVAMFDITLLESTPKDINIRESHDRIV